MPKTLPLDLTAWDLVLDPVGDLVLEDELPSIAQDVASAIRVFLGECWYDTTLGMPYFESIFGQVPPGSLVESKIRQAALTVSGVKSVKTVSLRLAQRKLTGIVVVTTTLSSDPLVVNF